MEKMLEGKVAIITGSGRGIGQATAKMLAREGAKVVVCDIDAAPANETVKEIIAGGGTAIVSVGSVSDKNYPDQLVDLTLKKFGNLHIIVNNAGVTWDSMIHKMSDEQWYAIIDIHLTGPFRILRAAGNFIREEAKKEIAEGKRVMRKVVNIMSVAGTMGNPGQVNYASAKAGQVGMIKTLAKEWGSFNVNCNAIAFGFIETRMTDEKEKGETATVTADEKVAIGMPKKVREMFINNIPLRRGASPEEAARGIFFLVSPLSDYVTGHVLKLDGGLDM